MAGASLLLAGEHGLESPTDRRSVVGPRDPDIHGSRSAPSPQAGPRPGLRPSDIVQSMMAEVLEKILPYAKCGSTTWPMEARACDQGFAFPCGRLWAPTQRSPCASG